MLGHALLDESEAVRAAAADALRAAGIDAAHAADRAAAPRAPDTRPEIKRLPDERDALSAALLDPSADVRGKALEQLAKRGDDAARDAAFEALADPAIGMRLSAISGLARFTKRDARVVPALLEALHDHADWVASAAAKALGQLKVSAAIPPIRERLLAFPDDYQVCLDALLGIGGPEAVAAAAAALAHPSRHARGSALLTLSNLGAEEAVAHMMTALDDADEDVRRQAACALAEKRHAPAVPALVRGYRRPSPWERRDVVDALGQFGGPAALRVLVAALRDRAKEVREIAVTRLVKLGDERGNRALASAARRDPATAALVPKSLLKAKRTRP
jgi:HEAT repeat protein